MSDEPQRPTSDDRDAWKAYWTVQGMPWRAEAEIDAERQAYLAERRAVEPDIEQGIYPFKGVKLDRAEVEWLLATHESDGMQGPVDWSNPRQRTRAGLDLRGADLANIDYLGNRKADRSVPLDLSNLPLAGLRAGAPFDAARQVRPVNRSGDVLIVFLSLAAFVFATLATPLISWEPVAALRAGIIHNPIAVWLFFAVVVGSLLLFVGAGVVISRKPRTSGARRTTRLFLLIGQIARAGFLLALLLFFVSLVFAFELAVGVFAPALTGGLVEGPVVQYLYLALIVLYFLQLSNRGVVTLTIGAADRARSTQSKQSGANLDGCRLTGAHLEGAQLGGASLRRADLSGAHLEHANLDLTHCHGTDFRRAVLDAATSLRSTELAPDAFQTVVILKLRVPPRDIAALGGVAWNGADLTQINWQAVGKLGDERDARITNLVSLQETVKTYHQLAQMLRAQGLFAGADRFAYRALVVQRKVLLRVSGILSWVGSGLLDLLAGYGYKPVRTIFWYLAVVLGFAFAYLHFGHINGKPFELDEALVFSVTSFHGRGFFPGTLSLKDLVVKLAAAEAVVGLLIEISFIATFTQRFFGAK